jgi:predicted nucleotide-binding protein
VARKTTKPRKGKKVFVVHGRDLALKNSMFYFLRALGLEPIDWNKALKGTSKGSPYIGEGLDQAFKNASAVVVLLTPDDQARLKKKFAKNSDPKWETTLTGQARPNVLFEAGMAFGRHADSTILVQVGELRPFSDIGGRHVIRLHDGVEARSQLADRLDTAGCKVDMSGTEWFSAGSFGSH